MTGYQSEPAAGRSPVRDLFGNLAPGAALRAPDDRPDYCDDIEAALGDTWSRLGRGAGERSSAFHTPLVASVRADLTPDVRTVVLRHADIAAGTLRFHTDRRSAKVAQLAERPACVVHVHDTAAKIQVRLDGFAALHTDDALADAAWAGARASSLICYAQIEPPGTPLDGALSLHDAADALARENFCAVVVTVERIDRLCLHNGGNSRAAWTREGPGWRGVRLAP